MQFPGSWVPEGTTVLVHTYALHRDERYFSPHPDSFHPQRWLVPNSTPNPQAFVPFSYGPENCVGKAFALLSLRLSLVLLVRHLDMEFDGDINLWKGEEGLWERELRDRYVLEKGCLEVKVRRRG
jgi:cytochrome P450